MITEILALKQNAIAISSGSKTVNQFCFPKNGQPESNSNKQT